MPEADPIRSMTRWLVTKEPRTLETMEMLTGLRYQDGERSRGISTGDQSPALIRGDAGIAIHSRQRRQRIRQKEEDQAAGMNMSVQTSGTLDSPEWRKGPTGPKLFATHATALGQERKEEGPQISPTATK
ncbi:hypothetical protein BKA64DRAFT_715455 [Cadophora sp. MPI-SDFR-AT-0126]|nr:hypothetical protein BKA64DRAFT_715455 [Leotiomycetes sp. MPI-SDFR-AT-0126]